jgi:hypothetical protein
MLGSLRIKNFRGIRKGSVELFPITILLGSNNSGKSAILESLFLLPNPARKVPYTLTKTPDFGRSTYDRALDVVSFLHESVDYKGYAFLPFDYTSAETSISCKVDGEEFELRFYNVGDQIYFQTNRSIENTYETLIAGKKERVFANSYTSIPQLDTRNPFPWMNEVLLYSSNLTRLAFDYLQEEWSRITNLGILRKVARDAASLSQDKYIDFTLEPFLGRKLEMQAYFKNGRRIRLGDIGEGIRNYVVMRILYEMTKPMALLWDDMEAHLNPRIILHLADWFGKLVEKKKQVIVTTHSLETARLIAGINMEESRVYVTSLSNSLLKIKPLTLEELEKLQKAGIDPRTSEALLILDSTFLTS